MASKLGRGLSALIPDYTQIREVVDDETSQFKDIPLKLIEKNRFQPRQQFSDNTIQELASSIKTNGLIQPIVVRKNSKGTYELISGERRLRAATMLGYESIPAIVKKEVTDQDSRVLSLIENIQREDINALDAALAYYNIINEHHYTQQQLAEQVGKSRSAITNALRLLELSDKCKKALTEGQITEGHARAILHFKESSEQDSLLQKITTRELSVREVENLINKSALTIKKKSTAVLSGCKFKTKILNKNNRGHFIVHFSSDEEFKAIKELLLNA